MKVYGSRDIRNVVFVGHGGSGKTSLVDALAFVAGSSRRRGSIRDGTTLTDTSPDEIERKHSIGLGLGYAEWLDTKLNLIDTPGYLEYFGEVVSGAHAADAAVVVVSGSAGVEVGTEKAWELCDELHLPRLLFVSAMDKDHADFERVYADIKAHLTPNVVPVEIPIGSGRDFKGIINLFSGHVHMYRTGAKAGEYDVAECPAEYQGRYQQYMEQFTEAVASTDDALIERYLAGEEIPRGEFAAAVKRGMLEGAIVPLFCGSAELCYGIRTLLKKMVELLPSPAETPPPAGMAAVDAPLAGRVFKVVSEPHVGDVTFFRLFTGDIQSGDEVWNAEHEVVERLNHLSVQQGRDRIEVERLSAGDIGSVAKLRNTHTNDTFCRRDRPVRLPPVPFPEAVATSAVVVRQRGDEDKLAAGLHRIHEEDPTFHFEYNSELGQTLIHGMGERHFDTLLARLARRHGVHAELVRPRVPYRETLRARGEGQGKHKKQSGGRGQYGDCWIRLSPGPRGSGYEFADEIVGGVIPNKYIPAVDRGVQEAAARGVIAGYPLVDFRVECYDGSYHDVDSNEMSFRMAGILAFRNVAPQCRPVLLEPLVEVEVHTPEDALGDVMGDLSARRGQILGTEASGRRTKVRAIMPQAELYRYSTALHSITHGRGTHHHQFHGYAEAPPDVTARVAAEHAPEHAGVS